MKNKDFIKLILCFIGLAMLSYFIWMRFIRERIPRDIPFNLSIIGFLILLYICCIYVYLIINLLNKNKTESKIISTIVSYIYKPLKVLDESIKTNSIIQPYYEKMLIYFVYFIKNNVDLSEGHSYLRLYIWVQIVPRIILVSALLVDTFYFHRLSILYNIILIGLIPLISKYIEYSFIYAREQYILKLENMVDRISTDYYDPDTDNPAHDLAFTRFVSVRTFLLVQALRLGKGLESYSYNFIPLSEFMQEYRKRLNIPKTKGLTKEQMDDRDKGFYQIMDIVIPLSVHIEEYSFPKIYERCKYAKVVIFSSYLLCWSYILIISFHTLSSDSFMFLLDIIDKEDPFSVTIMNSELEVNDNKSTDIVDKIEKYEEVD